MSRRSTAIWIVGAVVVVAAGVAVASVAATRTSTTAAPSTSSPAATPTDRSSTTPSSRATEAPSAPASSPASPTGSTTGPPPTAQQSAPTTSQPTSPPIAAVTPALSYYSFSGSTLTLGGGVSGLVDAGGSCTVTVSKGDATVSQKFEATPGPTSTDCGAMAITSPKFTPGAWGLTIAYSSPRASGTSATVSVTL